MIRTSCKKTKAAVAALLALVLLLGSSFGAFAIGSYGDENQYKEMRAKGHEMAIVGETCEWRFGEYVRDASQFGEHIALLTCGHQGSEAAGMKWHAELIKNQFPELETKYFECGEVWSF